MGGKKERASRSERKKQNCLFTENKIICGENPMESTKRLLELTRKCNKVVGYRINTQNQLYFYKLAINNQKLKFNKIILKESKTLTT